MATIRMRVVFHSGATGIIRLRPPLEFGYHADKDWYKEVGFQEGVAVWSLRDANNVHHFFNADGSYHDWEGPAEVWPFIDEHGRPYWTTKKKQFLPASAEPPEPESTV